MNHKVIDTFLQLGLMQARNYILLDLKLRHDLRKQWLDKKDFQTIYEIRNFKNKNKFDFANDEFSEFEPLGEILK